ncbi:MAG: thiamine ABC transporter substrate-binding protein [Methanomicrobia archaeon]|nr:thiamine ABC transporter substrate-binding protein [Methanomicrobia archaeon]MCK4310305.1 thiamine ABC transporter substrate-binding protein [Methanomicrobia archaeon]MCK4433713.1 thiamine ABC transporter substrate-binding protein [Methanomicrobia archaeon]
MSGVINTKRFAALLAITALVLALAGCVSEEIEEDKLVIYTYDSFVSEWGIGPKIVPLFEEAYNCKVEIKAVGDAGDVLNRAIIEKNNPRADILIGIDNNSLSKALKNDILVPYTPKTIDVVPEQFIFDPTYHVVPFDYGYIAFVYDSEIITPPQTFDELLDPKYKKAIILEDPRTSSPGAAFLLWTIAIYGENYLDFWEQLKPNILTITSGWDQAYGMFTSGEAPIVLSYATSPAYHVEYEDITRYKAFIPKDGGYLQIEGAGIVKNCAHKELAEKFIDWMLTEDFQREIPLTQWMFPVNSNVELPASFDYAVKPDKILYLDSEEIAENLDRWIKNWAELMIE